MRLALVLAVALLGLGGALFALSRADDDDDEGRSPAACSRAHAAAGAIELRYRAGPILGVGKVTGERVDEASGLLCRRLAAFGLEDSRIRRVGQDEIAVLVGGDRRSLKAVELATRRLTVAFYDWEPNIVGEDGEVIGEQGVLAGEGAQAANVPIAGSTALFEAVTRASETEPVGEAEDVPPGGKDDRELREAGVDPADEAAVERFYDRGNDTSADKYYLFGPNRQPLFEANASASPAQARAQAYVPSASCEELLTDFEDDAPAAGQRGEPREYARGTECAAELEALGGAGPPAGSRVVVAPRGIVVVEAERGQDAPASAPRAYFVLEDDSELDGSDVENPEQNTDPQTNLPVVTMEFTDDGRAAFAAVTRRIAERGSQVILPPGSDVEAAFQRFAITLDNRIVSLATINFRTDPEGIDGRTGAQITNIGSLQETQDLVAILDVGPLPAELTLISKRP